MEITDDLVLRLAMGTLTFEEGGPLFVRLAADATFRRRVRAVIERETSPRKRTALDETFALSLQFGRKLAEIAAVLHRKGLQPEGEIIFQFDER